MWIYLRGAIFVALIVGAARCGYRVAINVYDVLSFQLVIYKGILQAQVTVADTYGQVQEWFQQAINYLGLGEEVMESGKSEVLLDDRVTLYADKLRKFSNIVGILVSLLVFKIGFDIVFGLKKILQRIQSFILE